MVGVVGVVGVAEVDFFHRSQTASLLSNPCTFRQVLFVLLKAWHVLQLTALFAAFW